ncbi:unnamed protein product, partial [Symbiodinium sp. KB8]
EIMRTLIGLVSRIVESQAGKGFAAAADEGAVQSEGEANVVDLEAEESKETATAPDLLLSKPQARPYTGGQALTFRSEALMAFAALLRWVPVEAAAASSGVNSLDKTIETSCIHLAWSLLNDYAGLQIDTMKAKVARAIWCTMYAFSFYGSALDRFMAACLRPCALQSFATAAEKLFIDPRTGLPDDRFVFQYIPLFK